MNDRKTILIKFSGMSGRFDPEHNFLIDILKEKYDVRLSDNPEYLFYSVNSKDYLDYKCIRIFFTPENLVPDFNICDYAIGFSPMYFGDRYIRYPLYLVDTFAPYDGDDYGSDLERALHKHESVEEMLFVKEGFCAFVYSNAEAAICRERLFNALSEYKRVDSGGRYLNNIGGPVDSKYDFQRKYKFVIAFENSSTPGYTSEKIVHAFAAGAIPIYWGNPNIGEEFNEASFINCHRFGLTEKGEEDSIQRIVESVVKIDHDERAFLDFLRTPAFSDSNNVDGQKKSLRSFLFNIFDQPYEDAFRRNRYYWGERYERKQRIGNKFYWLCRKAIPIRDFFLRK